MKLHTCLTLWSGDAALSSISTFSPAVSATAAHCSQSPVRTGLLAASLLLLAACGGGGGGGTPAPVAPTLALPNLANASAVILTAGTRAAPIQFTNSGGRSLTTCRVTPNLPTGLSVSRTTGNTSCQITGTPTAPANLATYTVTATNATGADSSPATVVITVRMMPAPNIADANVANLDAGVMASPIRFTNSGGGSLTSCRVAPNLPTGLSVSRTTGNASCQISGTPAAASPRTTYTVTATNGGGSNTADVDIRVILSQPTSATPVVMSTSAGIPVTSAAAGTAYIALLADGATAPDAAAIKAAMMGQNGVVAVVSMAVTAGTQATLDLTSLLEGTDYDAYLVIEFLNGIFSAVSKIDLSTPLLPPNLADANAATFVVDTLARDIVFANNGGGSLTACRISPNLPDGLAVSRTTGNTSCQITGTPTATANRMTYTVTATNANGSNTADVDIWVSATLPAPDLDDANAASFIAGFEAMPIVFENTGGGDLTSCSVMNPDLPAGLTATRTTGNASCQITGTPTASANRATYTVTATNSGGGNTADVDIEVTLSQLTTAAANVMATTADIQVTSDAAGMAYISVLADGATAPTAAAIKAAMSGQNGVVAAESMAVTANTPQTIGLTGLDDETDYDAYIVAEFSNGVFSAVSKVDLTTQSLHDPNLACSRTDIDTDNDGLIDICTLAQLNNMRYSLTGSHYRTSASDSGDNSGCLNSRCTGYELMNDLDFDTDDDGTWTRNPNGTFTLDADDNNDDYFDTDMGGWVPIGDCGMNNDACGVLGRTNDAPFAATFEGNGFTINGLATYRDLRAIGLFGSIDDGADIRNLTLTGNLAAKSGSRSAHIGGLAGYQEDGDITSCNTSGSAHGGSGSGDSVGGLLGYLLAGTVTASRASGPVAGGSGNDEAVGGLVGDIRGGGITASGASGSVAGGPGNDNVGGLVGFHGAGFITASWANGSVDGEAGEDDVGGLVGDHGGTGVISASWAGGSVNGGSEDDNVGGLVGDYFLGNIIASYATGAVNGGAGNDSAGRLVGTDFIVLSTYTDSYGFSAVTSGSGGKSGSSLPRGVTAARQLTSQNTPASWNRATSNTRGAWNFGSASQNPALNYADYDGPGITFSCTSRSGAIVIPNCGTLIPGQRTASGGSASISSESGAVLSYAPPRPNHQAPHLPGNSQAAAEQAGKNEGATEGVVNGAVKGAEIGSSASGGINNRQGFSMGKGDAKAGAGATRISLTADANELANLIATFDDATAGPAAMRASPARYELAGIFADPSLANWNNFDGMPDAAHLGDASVSTWQIGTLHGAQATGSIRINGITITGNFLNFLMAGGGATLDGGRAQVGVAIYLAGASGALAPHAVSADKSLTTHSPNHCTDRYLKGDHHWAHIDVSSLVGMVVDIEIYDHDAVNSCGFIAFDHLYQSNNARGQLVGTTIR